MSTIIRLDSSIYNRIAAGEVVERPRSVVKELVENSIDAGANHILIEITDGGKEFIKIEDNGSGITEEDLPTAFCSHATSKIKNIDDLDKISTLGFRGEALPSIASIAIIDIISNADEENIGCKITLKNGEVVEKSAHARAQGTTIIVKNLFYNTPARAKFLKKDKSEENEITSLVLNLILANPNISFEYLADGKTIYISTGRGLEDAVYSVYSRDITNNLIPINKRFGGFSVKGYIGKPQYTKPTRAYQTTVINGRIINNQTITMAVAQAYGNNLMKRTYPIFILDIIMPFDSLDVNVTPNKTDVRFVDQKVVFSNIYHAINTTLHENESVFEYSKSTLSESQTIEPPSNSFVASDTTSNNTELTISLNEKKQNEAYFNDYSKFASSSSSNDYVYYDENKIKSDISGTKLNANTDKFNELVAEISTIKPSISRSIPQPTSLNDGNDNINLFEQLNLFGNAEKALINSDVKIIGQIFNTYVIISYEDTVYLIDQHAAHEKLLYDQLIKQIESNYIATQPLLIPEIIDLSVADRSYIDSIIVDLAKIGLEIEEFGNNTYKITSIPTLFKTFNVKEYISDILDNKRIYQSIKLKELLKEKLAANACRSAIKSGDSLNDYEIKSLVNMMNEGVPTQCPHGRPAIIKFTKKDLDKLFKRII